MSVALMAAPLLAQDLRPDGADDALQGLGEIIVMLRAPGAPDAPLLPFRDVDMLGLQSMPDPMPGGAYLYRLSFDALLSAETPEALAAEVAAVAAELRARPDVLDARPNPAAPSLSGAAP